MELVKISAIKTNPNNPRIIKDDKFKKLVQSIKDFPEMLEVRPIIINKENTILGGNMRYKAGVEAGLKEIPTEKVDWSEEKQKEFIIKDNISGGEWDWDILANEWNSEELGEWGLDVPEQFDYTEDNKEIEDINLGDTAAISFKYQYSIYLNLLDLLNNAREKEGCDTNEEFLQKILEQYV